MDWAGTPLRIKIGATQLIDGLDQDTDPSAGGSFEKSLVISVGYTGGETIFNVDDSWYSPEGKRALGDGLRLRAILLAGSGDDPFAP